MFKNKISKKTPLMAVFSAVFLFGLTAMACAEPNLTGSTGSITVANNMGDMFCNMYNNAKPFGSAFSWFAYVAGCILGVQGIYHFKAHSENPQNAKLHTPVMMWFGAMCLLALPTVIGTIVVSIYGTSASGGALSCGVGAVPSGGQSLDLMLSSFVGNIKSPLLSLVSIIAIVSGLFMIVKGLQKAGKHGTDPRAHSVHLILTNIVFGALLVTIGDNMNMMMMSVFGTTSVATSSVISWSFLNSLAGGTSSQFQTAVTAGLTFVQLIGAIAFVRGWLVLKKVVEGGGNATMAQGITHVIGGVLAINIYGFLVMMDKTFGTGLISG